MKHIVCFHLFNDYSGSPKVLAMILDGLLAKGYTIDLVTSRHGVLNELRGRQGIKFHTYGYRFSQNPFVTMLLYVYAQVYTSLFSFRYLFRKDVVFYINTILPVAPALAGKLMGKKVVYHYHENAFVKSRFYRLLAWLMQHIADEIICVSAYQASFLKRQNGVVIIPNALPEDFIVGLRPSSEDAFLRKNILMLSSLKRYKGTLEFMRLAKLLPQFKFTLVINDTQKNIDRYLKEVIISDDVSRNIKVYSRQSDVIDFYNNASLVLNLSDKTQFVETFGMTALEAMSCGLPVIVPTVGGIAEIVDDGVDGYKIDVHDLDKIGRTIELIFSDFTLYHYLAQNAQRKSQEFSYDAMINRVLSILYR